MDRHRRGPAVHDPWQRTAPWFSALTCYKPSLLARPSSCSTLHDTAPHDSLPPLRRPRPCTAVSDPFQSTRAHFDPQAFPDLRLRVSQSSHISNQTIAAAAAPPSPPTQTASRLARTLTSRCSQPNSRPPRSPPLTCTSPASQS